MARVPRITRPFTESLDDLRIVPGSPAARSVAATVRQIAEADELPLADDAEGPMPARPAMLVEETEGRRLLTAFARRVHSRRLWVWYRPRGAGHVDLVAVTATPPV